jgi:hypothetical protein
MRLGPRMPGLRTAMGAKYRNAGLRDCRQQRDRINVKGRAAKQGKSRLVRQKQNKGRICLAPLYAPCHVRFCAFPGDKFSVSVGFDQFLFETKVQ